MADFVLITGDEAVFKSAFDSVLKPAVVVVQPGTITGTGKSSLKGNRVCVYGDEKTVIVTGCAYTSGDFTKPGVGELKIASLVGDQIAQKTRSAGKSMIIKGSSFKATFEVKTPATMPKPPFTPDATGIYSGFGEFITKNTKWKVT
ncbi:MAG: hypothetical protein GY859_42075 [Desulfobacterales bacterium]|nr:hypothetical protein [Desulfobacterales bacterium]